MLLFAVLCSIVTGASAPGASSWPVPRSDIQANVWTASAQGATTVEPLPEGAGFVVAWDSRRQQRGYYGVYARRFDGYGRPLGGEVCLNSHGMGDQMRPALAADATGLWCAWQSFGQDGDRGTIIARRFDHDLRPLGAEIIVNATAHGHQNSPVIAAGPDGALVAWQDGATRRIHTRRVTFDGRSSTEHILTGPVDAWARRPALAAWSQGNAVLVWQQRNARAPWHIMAQRLEADGRPRGPAWRVTPADERHHVDADVATAPGGIFTVAWATSTGPDYLMHVQRHGPQGPVHAPAIIERGRPGSLTGLAVALRAADPGVVVWGATHAGTTHVYSRTFDARGLAVGDVQRVTRVEQGSQWLGGFTGARRVCWHAGRLLVAWFGDGGHADGHAACVTWIGPGAPAHVTPTEAPRRDGSAAAPHQPPTFDAGRPQVDRGMVIAAEGVSGDAGFVGILENGWNPPDPVLAVGPTRLVAMTNGTIAYFDKDGTLLSEQPINTPDGFWGEVGAQFFVFDPEVLYDPPSGRFFAMANERTGGMSYFLLAVSDDSDPEGPWFKYRFDVTAEADGDNDIDSPNMSIDDDSVLLTADFFGPDKFLIYAVDKQAVMQGDPPATHSTLWFNRHSLGSAVMPDGDAPAHYLVEAFFGFNENTINLVAVTDELTTMTIDEFELTVPIYQPPENAPSLGTTQRVETFEARVWNAMYRDGSLWITHHTGLSRVVQRWYEVAMNGWPTSGQMPELVQSGDIDPGGDVRSFFGAIWTDAAGDTAVVFARSSPNELISMARTARHPGDPPGTMRPPAILKHSSAVVDGDRWGDYCSVVEDPARPGVFWGHHEYFTGIWQTWITTFAAACTSTADCADLDIDGIRDDGCIWWACEAGDCVGTDIVFADMGGQFGTCPPDDSADSNDRFHALNCFADEDPNDPDPPNSYPCEPAPPAAMNVDTGGPFGDCQPDGTCDGNDAFHALAAFDGSTTCACPLNGGPAPVADATRVRHGSAALRLETDHRAARPGDLIQVHVILETAELALRGYQLHLGVRGGKAGTLELVDIAMGRHAPFARRQRRNLTPQWSAFNARTAQMVAGWDAPLRIEHELDLATYTYRIPAGASGRFVIEMLHDPADPQARTFLFGTTPTDRITVANPPCLILAVD